MAKRHYEGMTLTPVPIVSESIILDGSLTDVPVKPASTVDVDPYDYAFGSGSAFDGTDEGYDVTFE